MSESRDWLEILDRATTYRELQSAVYLMFVDATSTSDATALGAAIDEAIRRIEHERVRDQAELVCEITSHRSRIDSKCVSEAGSRKVGGIEATFCNFIGRERSRVFDV